MHQQASTGINRHQQASTGINRHQSGRSAISFFQLNPTDLGSDELCWQSISKARPVSVHGLPLIYITELGVMQIHEETNDERHKQISIRPTYAHMQFITTRFKSKPAPPGDFMLASIHNDGDPF
jgi:hypothetical protein